MTSQHDPVTSPGADASAEQRFSIYRNEDSPRIVFAVEELKKAISQRGGSPQVMPVSGFRGPSTDGYTIVLVNTRDDSAAHLSSYLDTESIGECATEGFVIRTSREPGHTICILGPDDAGVMYGGLEVAEIIRTRGILAVESQSQNPFMNIRGVKLNIPLDVRTPTYSEPSDAAQNNMAEMWDFGFWKEYIDHLALHRYNTISLWNMHPFPSMVKVPEYPDVALNDVRKSTVDWQEYYSLHGRYFDAPEIVNNFEVIRKMTIDEKIAFWRSVMAYGKDRNIQFFVLTWNIFDYGVEGKYGITDKLENPITVDYVRRSVRQMVLTYPDLAGIGLTTGENMYAHTATGKEEWAFATYGQGVLDALNEQPGRKITFIHRQHETQAGEIRSIFQNVIQHPDIDFVFSFKYAKAHVYSSTRQSFHVDFVNDIEREDLKTLWTLRNDDVFYFRWGAPGFVREFMRNIPYDVSAGYYYGSDHYVWGREFLTKNTDAPRELDIGKHWYQWMCWGRLGYNPDIPDERFVDILQDRFPEIDARGMFTAWQSASMVYPLVTGFHWGALDFQWYIESGQSTPWTADTPSGYHDVNRFITLTPHPATDTVSIHDYTRAFLSGAQIDGTTPLQVADDILEHAEVALSWTAGIVGDMGHELRMTIDDIQSIALMGTYYAHKVRAATFLSLFRNSMDPKWYEKVSEELNASAGYFRHFAAIATANYHNPLWTNRVGHVDWRKNLAWAVYDITANGGTVRLPSLEPTAGGSILEAEDADFEVSTVKSHVEGFTGTGYLQPRDPNAHHRVKWTFNAREAGSYTLEFRYTLQQQAIYPSPLVVNGNEVARITFWHTGNTGAWVWERAAVYLHEGENTIEISPIGKVLLDHLNVLKR